MMSLKSRPHESKLLNSSQTTLGSGKTISPLRDLVREVDTSIIYTMKHAVISFNLWSGHFCKYYIVYTDNFESPEGRVLFLFSKQNV